jgi:hypothetical protein
LKASKRQKREGEKLEMKDCGKTVEIGTSLSIDPCKTQTMLREEGGGGGGEEKEKKRRMKCL